MKTTCDLIVDCLWTLFVVVWLITSLRTKRNVRGKPWLYTIFRILIFVWVSFELSRPGNYSTEATIFGNTDNPILPITGTVLCAIGIAFAFWARFHIGQNWGAPMSVKENPQLVTTGPYQFVRHPIYGGLIVAQMGTSLVYGKFCLVILVFSTVYFVISATTEEKNMTGLFPATYDEYRRHSKMFVPFLF